MATAIALEQLFQRMGAKFQTQGLPNRDRQRATTNAHRINVRNSTFILDLGPGVTADVLDLQPKIKHLLLGVRQGPTMAKYLCGHDERQWFAAGVETNARTVENAMHLLQPAAVQEVAKKLPHQKKYTRKNEQYQRQGEWFFVPQPDLKVADKFVLHNEPIRRGRSRPHICQFLFRRGGTQVFVCRHYPNGLKQDQLNESWTKQLEGFQNDRFRLHDRSQHTRDQCQKLGRWMTRDAEVYAKGRIWQEVQKGRESEHEIIKLKGWFRVYMNTEVVTESMAFLD